MVQTNPSAPQFTTGGLATALETFVTTEGWLGQLSQATQTLTNSNATLQDRYNAYAQLNSLMSSSTAQNLYQEWSGCGASLQSLNADISNYLASNNVSVEDPTSGDGISGGSIQLKDSSGAPATLLDLFNAISDKSSSTFSTSFEAIGGSHGSSSVTSNPVSYMDENQLANSMKNYGYGAGGQTYTDDSSGLSVSWYDPIMGGSISTVTVSGSASEWLSAGSVATSPTDNNASLDTLNALVGN